MAALKPGGYIPLPSAESVGAPLNNKDILHLLRLPKDSQRSLL
jgi:hypothetical protein